MTMTLTRFAGHDRPTARRFVQDRRALAATEFALVLPIALVLLTGAIGYGDAIAIDRKVTLTARTVTDLVTQSTSISIADMRTLLGASSVLLSPYSSANSVVTVSEVQTDASGQATVTWSQSLNGTARPIKQIITLPAAIDNANATYILGEVQYTYTPSIGYQVTGPITLHDQTYMSPRLSTTIALTP